MHAKIARVWSLHECNSFSRTCWRQEFASDTIYLFFLFGVCCCPFNSWTGDTSTMDTWDERPLRWASRLDPVRNVGGVAMHIEVSEVSSISRIDCCCQRMRLSQTTTSRLQINCRYLRTHLAAASGRATSRWVRSTPAARVTTGAFRPKKGIDWSSTRRH